MSLPRLFRSPCWIGLLAGVICAGSFVAQDRTRPQGALGAAGSYDPFNSVRIQVDGAPSLALVGEELAFDVTVFDPQGDLVSLELLNPPAGLIFHPARDVEAPTTREIRWPLDDFAEGTHDLVFLARDNGLPRARARHVLRLVVRGGNPNQGVHRGDIDGDGSVDLIVSATRADVQAFNSGAVYVWTGEDLNGAGQPGFGSPSATLSVPAAGLEDRLGHMQSSSGPESKTLLVRDVTGDGIDDVIVGCALANTTSGLDTGAIYIWEGDVSFVGDRTPAATLVPGSAAGTLAGLATGTGLLTHDITGDGVLDVIVGARMTSVDGEAGAGVVHVWNGGALVGERSPSSTLRMEHPLGFDFLGFVNDGAQALRFGDVTGDGIDDLLVGASRRSVGGVWRTGAIYVWEGGAPLEPIAHPDVSLFTQAPTALDALTNTSNNQSFQLVDVNGDGKLDVVAGAPSATVDGQSEAGAIYIWYGGALLAGAAHPNATLEVPGALAGARLGSMEFGHGILFSDLDANGTLDIIAAAPGASLHGLAAVGAIYVWLGGSGLQGTVAPDGVLRNPDADQGDQMSRVLGQGILISDVTGDHRPDLIAGSSQAELARGEVYVFDGTACYSGECTPRAVVQGLGNSDQLGYSLSGRGLKTGDVTGDGIDDLVAASRGLVEGNLLVWAGGSGLVGSPAPRAVLEAGENGSFEGFYLVDVTGDGALDFVVWSPSAPANGFQSGAAFVWSGAGIAGSRRPDARLAPTGASDLLGFSPHAPGLRFADLNSDGIVDVLAPTTGADIGSAFNAGALFAWAGGPQLSGDAAPLEILTRETPGPSDELGSGGVYLDDFNGDGHVDILAATPHADLTTENAGALFLWLGTPAGFGSSELLTVPGASAFDELSH